MMTLIVREPSGLTQLWSGVVEELAVLVLQGLQRFPHELPVGAHAEGHQALL